MNPHRRRVGFWAYWARAAKRAALDTMKWFPITRTTQQAFVNATIFVLASLILFWVAGITPVIEEWNAVGSAAAAAILVGTLCYLFNFIATPHRMDAEIHEENESLRIRKADAESKRKAAKELRELLTFPKTVSGLPLLMQLDALKQWDDEVVATMRKYNVPENEIHMYDTVYRFSIEGGMCNQLKDADLKVMLDAKWGKLRLIINRLLEDE